MMILMRTCIGYLIVDTWCRLPDSGFRPRQVLPLQHQRPVVRPWCHLQTYRHTHQHHHLDDNDDVGDSDNLGDNYDLYDSDAIVDGYNLDDSDNLVDGDDLDDSDDVDDRDDIGNSDDRDDDFYSFFRQLISITRFPLSSL